MLQQTPFFISTKNVLQQSAKYGYERAPLSYRHISVLLLIALIIFTPVLSNSAQAQSSIDSKKIAAVIAAVNLVLSDDPKFIKLTINRVNTGSYKISDEFEVTYNGQSVDINFCFNLGGYSDDSDLKLILNGGELTGLNNGRNCYLIDSASQLALNSAVFSYVSGKGDVMVSQLAIEERSLELDLDQLTTQNFTIRDQFDITFSDEPDDIEFCFILNSVTSGLRLDINGSVYSNFIVGENCFVIPTSNQQATNTAIFSFGGAQKYQTIAAISISRVNTEINNLGTLTRSQWDERAVRKVLKIFAFGGHARDAQITLWADMPAVDAIEEMLTFDEHNLKLSPLAIDERYRQTATKYGKLLSFTNFLSNSSSNLPIPAQYSYDGVNYYAPREQFGVDNYNFDAGYIRMVTTRGLNPFRQRIGFWETNYHLAINLDTAVSNRQLVTYYDLIMEAHESGTPYYKVMGIAAKSAAIAMQYGHYENAWVYDEDLDKYVCNCNEDFAREIHQLFYGIFGEGDDQHETVTIPETAKLLTGMPVPYIDNFGYDTKVDFNLGLSNGPYNTATHHLAPVTVLGVSISGSSAAKKINSLMPISMQHPESLKNLPVMIISVLADDNLDESRSNQLRSAWASMGVNRTLLEFLQTYAISDLFHSKDQFKYLTSHERALYIANKSNFDNFESYIGGDSYVDSYRHTGKYVDGVIVGDAAGPIFRPIHNVFGGQTSLEASNSSLAFEKNYNLLYQTYQYFDSVYCRDCDQGRDWKKGWEDVLPKRSNGKYYVADAAEWLWNHVVGNMDNYTELERAHLYTLLGAAYTDPGADYDRYHFVDLPMLICKVEDMQREEGAGADISLANLMSSNNYWRYCSKNYRDGVYDSNGSFTDDEVDALNRAYTGEYIANSSEIQGLLSELGDVELLLNTKSGLNGGADLQERSRQKLNLAMQFIFTTPFVFAEGEL